MTRTATPDASVTTSGTQGHALPLIDPRSLTRGQLAGRRCAVPNCRRLLADLVYLVGRLPDGGPVLACEDCAPRVSYQVSEAPAGEPGRRPVPRQRGVPDWA